MAERRMFTKKITDDDNFITLPSSAQALYFHLNQGADDDGFNNQVQIAMWKAHASIDDLKVLMAKNYILRFESGVIVIKHWRMHNTLRKDRYTPTNFQEELRQLGIKDNGAYTLGCQAVAEGLPNGCPSIGKVSKGKVSVVEGSIGEGNEEATPPTPTKRFAPPAVDEVRDYCLERGNHVDPQRFVDYYTSNGWMVGKNKMKDWKAAVRTWEQKEKPHGRPAPKSSNPFLDLLAEEGDAF